MLLKNTLSYKRFLYALVFIITSIVANAQNIKFKHISIDEGLSAVSVNTILQDSKDFIWIGTQDGLNRYDGYHIKTFKTNQYDKQSLSSNYINCLFEDTDGSLYIGTNDGGLSVYNPKIQTFTNYKSGLGSKTLSNNSVRHIVKLNDTELLIATEEGFNIFNKTTKQFTQINESNNLAITDLKQIFKTKSNSIYVASFGKGVFEFIPSSKTLVPIKFPNNIINSGSERLNIRCITEINNVLWFGTDDGIITFDPTSKKFDVLKIGNTDDNKYNNRIISFSKDVNSNFIWIGTWGGLVKYNIYNGAYHTYQNTEHDATSLADNKISCLFTDKHKNLWVGTQEQGVNIYFPSSTKFSVYNHLNNLTNSFIYSVIETKNKTLWVGTAEGLFTKTENDTKFNDVTNLISKYDSKTVLSLLEDNKNRIWIGTYGQGVIVVDPATKNVKRLLADNNLGGTVTKIIQSKNGSIWVGTYEDGLYHINPETFEIKRYTQNEGLSSDKIYSLYEDKSNNTLWIGTEGGGLCVFDFVSSVDKPLVTVYKHIENKNSISSNSVNGIYKDEKGIFWIATIEGLNKLDPKTKQITIYNEKDGMVNSYIYDVLPDKKGNLWLPSNNGLTKFSPSITSESAFKNYNTKDGIQAREFNQGASFLASDGKIYVGGVSGLNYFYPDDIKETNTSPSASIYSFSRQGKEIKTDTNIIYKKYIELSYKENYFTLELVTLDFVSPDRNKFMCILEGYDNDWSTPSDLRYISYTELPGGTYTFKVKSTNSDGVWNETPYEITIKVIPPWWRTTWFYITAIILATGLVFGFISYRTNSIKKENKILENKVAERTKELAEKNRDITSSIEYAKRIQEAILPSQDLIFSKLQNAFILYKPKDIVSGDFYWFGEKNNFKIIAAVDCTGHGVPGAFMSMIGHNLLNQIVAEKDFSDPGLILNELHKGVQAALKQGQNQINTNDGMDVALVAVNTDTREIYYAGAFRSLVIVSNEGNLDKIDGNKYPVGGAQLDTNRVFNTHRRQLSKNDCIYLFSDGYADQFGGDRGKKFMVKRFHDILVSIHDFSVNEQQKELEKHFNDWKGDFEQVDDVLVIGIKM